MEEESPIQGKVSLPDYLITVIKLLINTLFTLNIQLFNSLSEFTSSQETREDYTPARKISQDDEEEEEDDGEEEARGRFRSERDTSGPVTSNRQQYGNIPDSLGTKNFIFYY